MRTVTNPNLCHECLETLWLTFLEQVSIIDGVTESCISSSVDPSSKFKVLTLDLIPLAGQRMSAVDAQESYSITWRKDGQILRDFTNHTGIEVPEGDSIGSYDVHVKFATEDVRVSSPVMESTLELEVKEGC